MRKEPYRNPGDKFILVCRECGKKGLKNTAKKCPKCKLDLTKRRPRKVWDVEIWDEFKPKPCPVCGNDYMSSPYSTEENFTDVWCSCGYRSEQIQGRDKEEIKRIVEGHNKLSDAVYEQDTLLAEVEQLRHENKLLRDAKIEEHRLEQLLIRVLNGYRR